MLKVLSIRLIAEAAVCDLKFLNEKFSHETMTTEVCAVSVISRQIRSKYSVNYNEELGLFQITSNQ